jgi:hypothetical protein
VIPAVRAGPQGRLVQRIPPSGAGGLGKVETGCELQGCDTAGISSTYEVGAMKVLWWFKRGVQTVGNEFCGPR